MTKEPSTGHGWLLTGSFGLACLGMGLLGGTLLDTTMDDLAAYKNKAAVTADPVNVTSSNLDPAGDSDAKAAWFPDNNTIEWSTSLRPADTPTALDIQNADGKTNLKVVFVALAEGAQRQAALIYVRAGQRALIHLPVARYRVDVARSAASTPWEQAQATPPIPSFGFDLPEADNNTVPDNRLTISADGKVSFNKAAKTASKAASPSKASASPDDDEQEYADLDTATPENP